MYETWLKARMAGPCSGLCSMPRQVRRNSAVVGGMLISQPSHSQYPSLGRLRRTIRLLAWGLAPGIGPSRKSALMSCRYECRGPWRRPAPPARRADAGTGAERAGGLAGWRAARMAAMRWSVVIPVKRLPLAKSRLNDGTRPPGAHRRLALALALDTTAAALDCPAVARVVAVTDDRQAARRLAALGAVV